MLLLHHVTFSQLLLQRQFRISSLPAFLLSVGLSCLSCHIFLFRAHCDGGRPAVNQPLPVSLATAAPPIHAGRTESCQEKTSNQNGSPDHLTHGPRTPRTRAARRTSPPSNSMRADTRCAGGEGQKQREEDEQSTRLQVASLLIPVMYSTCRRNYLISTSTSLSSILTSSRPVFLRVNL